MSQASGLLPISSAQLRSELLASIRLAIPMAGAQLATIALQVTDNIICGRLGANSLAGVALGSAAYSMLFYPLMGVVQAVSPMVAQAHGANDPDKVRQSLHHAILLAIGLGLLMLVVMGQIQPILKLLGQPPELIQIASDYVLALRWAALPGLLMVALRGFLDSLSMPRIGLIVAISGIFINALGNWLLVFGNAGFPRLGVVGSGWATCLVNVFMCTGLLLFTFLQPRFKSYHLFSGLHIRQKSLGEYLRIGLPMACSITAEVWLFTGMSIFMGWLGSKEVAAHQIALGAASVTFMIALGIANAATVRVGQAIGQGDPAQAQRAGLMCMALGMSCMSCTALVFWLLPQSVIGVYLNLADANNQHVVKLAAVLLQYAALFQIFDALQVTSQGSLRGLKDTFAPMLIGFGSYWIIGLGSGLFFGFALNWGAAGLWLGLVLGLVAAGFALCSRFLFKSNQLKALN